MQQNLPQNQDRELGWDEEIDANTNDYILLTPGEYQFTVTNVEKARHNPNPENPGKLPPCNKAIIHIRIDSPQGQVNLKNNLFMHTSCMGLLAQFFKSIGQRQTGEKIKMNWATVPGSMGICKIKHRTHNDKTYNEIDRFLEPKEQTQQPQPVQPAQQQPMQQGTLMPQAQQAPQRQPGNDVQF